VYCINEQQQEVNKVLFTSEVYCLQLRDKGQVGEITNKLWYLRYNTLKINKKGCILPISVNYHFWSYHLIQ